MTAHAERLEADRLCRQRALEPSSFIVEAPAGAGKTELLTQRVLKLLAGVDEPEEIVAITFTIKAAAEMQQRIVDSLELAASGTVDPARLPAHKRQTFELARKALAASQARGWDLLDNPGRLRVMTIDALCASLARQMPFLSRFGAQPRIADDATVHYREAVRRTLALLEEDGTEGDGGPGAIVAAALRHFDNDSGRLGALLSAMLMHRDQWLSHALTHAAADAASAADAAQRGLALLVEADLRQNAAVLDGATQERLMPLARQAAANLVAVGSTAPIVELHDWDRPLLGKADELPLWRGVAELLLTQEGVWRKAFNKHQGLPPGRAGEGTKQALRELIGTLPAEAEVLLAGTRNLPDPQYRDDEWRIVAALTQLLTFAAAQLWIVFNEAGEADFVEVAQRALQALGAAAAPSELALQLDYRISHLLVDEFQDTSPVQIRLLQALTAEWTPDEGRTLFVVGDPMQSIYRFRKADVGLFLRAADVGIGAARLERLSLCRNNRSCPALVDWVNGAFPHALAVNDKVIEGAVRYRSFVPTRDALPGAGVHVEALACAADVTTAEVQRLEARRVLRIIESLRQEDPHRTVAVLVRARDHLAPLLAEIRRAAPALHFQAVEIDRLAERQVVQDLLALTHALHHRADRVNWLAMLRAPWCGLTLADLHALAADDHDATIWSLMNDEATCGRLSTDGQSRLRHVRAVLAEAYAGRGRQSPRRWVEAVWTMLGGSASLASPADAGDASAFLELIEQLDAAGRFSPERLSEQVGELYAAPDSRADDSLQFMTIHKAKGLEFDTVILPGLHRRAPGEAHALMLWEEVALDGLEEQLVVAPFAKPGWLGSERPSAYDYLQRLNGRRAANEAARVLYVAATRAIRSLYLVGVARPNAEGELTAPAGSFLDLLWPALAGSFSAVATIGATRAEVAGQGKPAAVADPPRLRRLISPAIPDALRPSTQRPGVTLDEGGAPGDEESGVSLEASVGTLVHAYLEIMARSGHDAWGEGRLRALLPAMALWLGQRGHGPEEARRGAVRAVTILLTTLGSAAGQWLLALRPDSAAELARSRVGGEADRQQVSTHVVDRTFVDAGQRWIIDYKTGHVDEDRPTAFKEHAERYRTQLERYALLFEEEGLPRRIAIFYAAHGCLVELDLK